MLERTKVRLERQRAKAAPRAQSRPDEISTRPERKDRAESRYIPSEVRERVFERAGHQCHYRSADGTRCSARTRLEIEHVRPFAIYRSQRRSSAVLHGDGIQLRLVVPDSLPGGLAIYGARFGRYPLDPTLVFVLSASSRSP